MNSETRLWELVSQWQRGEAASLAELCRDCPELLPDLRRHLEACRRMEHFAGENGATVDEASSVAGDASAQTRVWNGSRAEDTAETAAVSIPGYEVLGELGRGGMGVVYKARQLGLNRLVALKMILSGVHAGEQEQTRFLAEAEAIARLQHPNVVQVFEVGQHQGNPYLSLEFVEGGTLAARLRGEPQQPEEAAQLVETLALAVQAAHEQGIVHRDLKPGNVLLASGGRQSPGSAPPGDCRPPLANVPKIADFGLAKRQDAELTSSGAIVGTPAYMAPEQARGDSRAVGPSADVYALGAILYELLTGRPPFKAATGWDTMQLLLHTEPLAPTRLQPGVPRDLETICLKCLHKEPARRYASAAALAADCRAFLEGRPIAARRTGLVERGWRWAKRRPAAASLLVVSGLAILVLLGLGFWYSGRLGAMRAERRVVRERAASERYYALRHRIQERSLRREPGWTWANLDDLGEAAQLRDAGPDLPLLRAEAGLCLGSRDLKRSAVVGKNNVGWSVAWHPDGRRVAVGMGDGGLFAGLIGQVKLVTLDPPIQEQSLPCVTHRFRTDGLGLDHVLAIAFSPDGRWLVAGMRSGLLNRWDLRHTDPKPTSWEAHTGSIQALVFDRQGASLVSLAHNAVKRWDVPTWEERSVGTLSGLCETLALHPTEFWLACATQEAIHCLDVGKLSLVRLPLKQRASRLAWLPSGRSLAVAADGVLSLLDIDANTPPQTFLVPGEDNAGNPSINALAVSPDGALILAGSVDTGHVKLWDALNGQLLADLVVGGRCAVAFAPDSRAFAVCGDRQTLIYSVRDAREHTVVALQGDFVQSFALNPDGRSLTCVHAAATPGPGEELVWSLDEVAHQPLRRTGIDVKLPALKVETVDDLVATANDLVASGSRDGTVKLWRRDGRELIELWSWRGGRPVRGLAFGADGVTLAVLLQGERGVRLWHFERLWERLAQLGLGTGLGTLTARPQP